MTVVVVVVAAVMVAVVVAVVVMVVAVVVAVVGVVVVAVLVVVVEVVVPGAYRRPVWSLPVAWCAGAFILACLVLAWASLAACLAPCLTPP